MESTLLLGMSFGFSLLIGCLLSYKVSKLESRLKRTEKALGQFIMLSGILAEQLEQSKETTDG